MSYSCCVQFRQESRLVYMRLLVILAIQIFTHFALADWQWTPASNVNLYSAPNDKSTVVRSLEGGKTVLITKLQKATSAKESTEWVGFTLVEDDNEMKVYVTKKLLGEGEIKNIKKRDEEIKFLKNFGIGLVISQTLRGPISKEAGTNQTVEYGLQYGIAPFPVIHYETTATNGNMYRFFAGYRISKSQGEAGIKQNGILTSQELVTQSLSFMSVGILFRERASAKSNFWWGYGAELAKAIDGKQEYTDGTSVDLKDSLPTNFYLQGSLGYNSYPPKSSQWMPEARVGVVINNKPVTATGELIFNWVKAF